LIDKRAASLGFHYGGPAISHRERAEDEVVHELLGDLPEGPAKQLIEHLLSKM